jgi:hypothetical protein
LIGNDMIIDWDFTTVLFVGCVGMDWDVPMECRREIFGSTVNEETVSVFWDWILELNFSGLWISIGGGRICWLERKQDNKRVLFIDWTDSIPSNN